MKRILLKWKVLWAGHRRAVLVALAAVLVAAAAAVALPALLDPYDCRMVENVTIGGLDVGGMTRGEAKTALKAAANSWLCQDLTIQLPKESLTFSQKDWGLKLRLSQAVRDAYKVGRREDCTETALPLTPYLRYDRDVLCAALEDYAARFDTSLTQPSYILDGVAPELGVEAFDPDAPCQTLVLTLGTPELHLDTEAVLAQLEALYCDLFAAQSTTLVYTPEPEAVPEEVNLESIWQETSFQPVNDSLDMETYEFVHGRYGYGFDLEAAGDALKNADYGDTISLPMAYTEPEILGDAVYFRDVLGTCETRHTDDENRNTNLRLVCQILDGWIVQPGETFSYNQAVGERTAERGFKSAGAYSGTRLIQSIGGGVCQGSTTLYNCVLLADLEVTERVCHGFTVNYVPIGLDAAVNWATNTDFAFRNNWHFPIMIKAEVSDGYMKMQILGTDEKDYYIKMTSGYSEEELRIYANSYKYKYDKVTGEQISRELEARSSYMYFS